MNQHAVAVNRFVQNPVVGHLLQLDVGVHLAPDDSRIQQHQQTVDQHFAAAIKPGGEGHHPALRLDQRLPGGDPVQLGQACAVGFVIGLSRKQGGGQGVAHRTDADLQRAAVAHQHARVQANEMILNTDRHVWR